jgi:hypothetical protein
MSNVIIGGTATGATPLPLASTIDPVLDLTPIYTASALATQAINRNTYLGLASQPVGTNDTQTLTAKTLTTPTINGATLSGTLSGTYTLGGTPTFPSSVVTLTGTQTLTGKTLTSPTINSPSITNATITADTVAGYTVSNNGTIYGMSVTGGVLASAALLNTVNTAALQTNAVGASNLATNAITLASIGSSTTQSGIGTSDVLVTNLTTTVTIPTGGRKVRVEAYIPRMFSTAICNPTISIYNSTTVTGSPIQAAAQLMAIANNGITMYTFIEYSPSAGSQSYCVSLRLDAGSGSTVLSAASLAFLTVKVI